MKLCDYGCGREAKHQFKNGKWCCSESYNSCSMSKENQSKLMKEVQNDLKIRTKQSKSHKRAWKKLDVRDRYIKAQKERWKDPKSKEKQSKLIKKLWKDPEIRKKQIKSKTFTIEQYQKKYPTFSKEEKMRYNPDKPEEKEIQVHCKYKKCKNSKENGGWFTPNYEQFRSRRDALEHVDGNDGCYFYCSEKCKHNCCLFYLQSDPNMLNEFKKYDNIVRKKTNITLKKFKVDNIELRGRKNGYALDHKFTIYNGFINNVDPKIISHWKNLQIITISENSKKNKTSSITLEELLKEIEKHNLEENK